MFKNLAKIGMHRVSIMLLLIILYLIILTLRTYEYNLQFVSIKKQMLEEIQPGLDTEIALSKLRPLATIHRRCSIITNSITHERSVMDAFIYGQNAELILRLVSEVASDNTQKVVSIGFLESNYRNWFDHCTKTN